jgi:hypothetical protein
MGLLLSHRQNGRGVINLAIPLKDLRALENEVQEVRARRFLTTSQCAT